MAVLFLNKEIELFFKIHGYFKLENVILDKNEIDELLELKNTMLVSIVNDKINKDFFVGLEHPNKMLVRNVSNKIISIISNKINPYLMDYKPFLASFIIKQPIQTVGDIFPHQDWTFVEDETSYTPLTCWIPLSDVNIDNGCLGVIKGSHNFLNNIRHSPPTTNAPSPLAKHTKNLIPYFKWMPMKAGEVLFFDYRIFHASLSNISNFERTAIGIWYAHNNAEFRHYYLKPNTNNLLLKYKVDADFYIKYDNLILSKMYNNNKVIEDYEILETIKIIDNQISSSKLMKMLKKAGNKKYNINIEYNNILNKKDSFLNKVLNKIFLIFHLND